MTLRYLSVCSGIEAATVAWQPLGWKAEGFAEIDKFPSAVLAHHYPRVENHGDFTKISRDGAIDVLVGGTPCQSFSVAGLRQGLDDARGNLALEFCRLARRLAPAWLVWENVPGVLSLDGGRAFASILGGLAECGYGLAYRVLDAQFFGVPQRRRRVFVVGHLGDWRRAAAVLFEPEGLRGDSPPRREAGQGAAPTIAARTRGGGGLGTDFDCDGGLLAFGGNNTRGPVDIATARNAHAGPHGRLDFETETFVAHALRADGFDAGEDGTGRGTPLVVGTMPASGGTERKHGHGWGQQEYQNGYCIAFAENSRAEIRLEGGDGAVASSLKSGGGKAGQSYPAILEPICFAHQQGGSHDLQKAQGDALSLQRSQGLSIADTNWRVRRLTPVECERLQGFPDNYTNIPYRGKPAADGPRYKALGNSMAVPCMAWIGKRVDMARAA